MLRAQILGEGVGCHSHRYKRDGKIATGQETSATAGSHTHTGSPLLGNLVSKHYSVAALDGDSAEGHTRSWTCS